MTISHIQLFKKELEKKHWVIRDESSTLVESESLYWSISRPNGDCPLILEFAPGWGDKYGHIKLDRIEDALACEVKGVEMDCLYFGSKYSGKFQDDVVNFVKLINDLDRK